MSEEKTCYNCGNKNCHIFYYSVKQDVAEHHETYEYTEFDCVNHDKWKELKVEEIRTDDTETLINALERIAELEKENAELKAQISILLSCENCPENKGGYICQKEYNDKCLAQKIQYIKELKEENTKLKGEAASVLDNWCRGDDPCPHLKKRDEQLTKAKEIIKKIEKIFYSGETALKRLSKISDILAEAEQFIKEKEQVMEVEHDKLG